MTFPSFSSYDNINARPMYFDRLSEEDQTIYKNMQQLFSIRRYPFSEILTIIRDFCFSSTDDKHHVDANCQENSSVSSEPLDIPKNDNSLCYSCGYGYAGYNSEFSSYAKAAERASSVRMLVCGVCWIHPGFSIALNFKQLRVLIGQVEQVASRGSFGTNISGGYSKSSLTASLQRLGYIKVPPSSTPSFLQQQSESDSLHNYSTELIVKLQILHPEPSFVREWAFFQMAPSTPEPQRPTFNISSDIDTEKSTGEKEKISSVTTRISFPSLSLFSADTANSNFMSPQPKDVAPVDLDEAKVCAKKFECLRDEFFFEDPFCLPPAFMLDDLN